MTFSVIIPLYNKEREIARALRSALAQTLPPLEIVVVDDGSQDGSAAVVENIAAEAGKDAPAIKLVSQSNAGETAARNRGMGEASGDYFALLDADDEWRPAFLEHIAALIGEHPGAGIYCTGFDIEQGGTLTPGRTPENRGVVEDFFTTSMRRFVATASSSVLPRTVVDHRGGFPTGMKLGGDQYMWINIALHHTVVFSPERLAVIHTSASNRSATTYTSETTNHSFLDFYSPDNRPIVNEFIARVALGKAITATVRGGTDEGLKAERSFAYNHLSRRLWWRLWILDRLPCKWRPLLNGLYNRLAWRLVRKGV